METSPYESFITSPPVTIAVGASKKELIIHSALLAQQSKVLDALINNGQMKESLERRIVWDETEEDTAFRFTQYIYTGSYREAVPTERVASEADATTGIVGATTGDTPQPQDLQKPRKKLKLSNEDKHDYSEVYLCHARLYILAEYYDIAALQTLALNRLQGKLQSFESSKGQIKAIIEFIKYCVDIGRGNKQDKFGSLVCDFCASRMIELWTDADFRVLVATSPELCEGVITSVGEILGKLKESVITLTSKAQTWRTNARAYKRETQVLKDEIVSVTSSDEL